MMGLGHRVALSGAVHQATTDFQVGVEGQSTRDLLSRLAFVTRKPEPRHVRTQLVALEGVQRACIAVPATSQVIHGLRVPFDAELRLGMALPEGVTQALAFQVQVEGNALLEHTLTPTEGGRWHDVTLDLHPYGSRQVRLALITHPAGGGLPPGARPEGRCLWPGCGLRRMS